MASPYHHPTAKDAAVHHVNAAHEAIFGPHAPAVHPVHPMHQLTEEHLAAAGYLSGGRKKRTPKVPKSHHDLRKSQLAKRYAELGKAIGIDVDVVSKSKKKSASKKSKSKSKSKSKPKTTTKKTKETKSKSKSKSKPKTKKSKSKKSESS